MRISEDQARCRTAQNPRRGLVTGRLLRGGTEGGGGDRASTSYAFDADAAEDGSWRHQVIQDEGNAQPMQFSKQRVERQSRTKCDDEVFSPDGP